MASLNHNNTLHRASAALLGSRLESHCRPVHHDVLGLADPVGPVDALVVHARVPGRVQDDHAVGRRQGQAQAAHLRSVCCWYFWTVWKMHPVGASVIHNASAMPMSPALSEGVLMYFAYKMMVNITRTLMERSGCLYQCANTVMRLGEGGGRGLRHSTCDVSRQTGSSLPPRWKRCTIAWSTCIA